MARIRISFPETTLFTHELAVRITDLNYGNHLAHDTLVSLLHEARARFFRMHEMEEGDVDGAGVILTDLAVSYRTQAFFGQALRVEIGVGSTSSRGCELLYRVTNKKSGDLVALASTGILFFDYAANKVVTMPPRFASVLAGN